MRDAKGGAHLKCSPTAAKRQEDGVEFEAANRSNQADLGLDSTGSSLNRLRLGSRWPWEGLDWPARRLKSIGRTRVGTNARRRSHGPYVHTRRTRRRAEPKQTKPSIVSVCCALVCLASFLGVDVERRARPVGGVAFFLLVFLGSVFISRCLRSLSPFFPCPC